MAFKYDFSQELEETLEKLWKKNKLIYEATLKKVDEIASRDEQTIEHYKNLRYGLKDFKRVHIAKSFVQLFKVFKKDKFVIFDKLKHHDDVYK